MSYIQDYLFEYDFAQVSKHSQEAISVMDDQSSLVFNNASIKILRNSWTIEEDNLLLHSIKRYGQDWKKISKQFNKNKIERGPKACRERYQNQVSPLVKKKNWSKEEENKLFQLQNQLGNKWSDIAEQLPNRTDQIVKNYFYATVRRVLRRLLKAAGNKNCSDLAREIKPCVLSRIFSLNEKEDKRIVLDTQFTQQFRGLILKYRNISFSQFQNISPNDLQNVSNIYDNLVKINYQYKDQKEVVQQQKSNFKGTKPQVQLSIKDLNKKKRNSQEIIDEILLEKIVKKQPVFTTALIRIEKHYKQINIVENKFPKYMIQDKYLQISKICTPVCLTEQFECHFEEKQISNNLSQNYSGFNGDECFIACEQIYEINQYTDYSTVPIQSDCSIFSMNSQQYFNKASLNKDF